MQKTNKFSERLSELMIDANNITTDKLGEHLGTSGALVRMWRAGRSIPTLANTIRIAEYFNCTLDFLFGRSDDDINFTPQTVPPFYNRLLVILKKNRVSWYRVVKDTKISQSNLQDWRDGCTPRLPTLIELAEYFGVSLDYLIGREK